MEDNQEKTENLNPQETVETKIETTAPETKVEKTVPLSVLIEERRKRQDAQREVDLLRIRQVSPQQEAPKTETQEDPEPDSSNVKESAAWAARQEWRRLESGRQQQQERTTAQTELERGLASVKNTVARLSVEDPEFEIKLETARGKGMNIPVQIEALIGDTTNPGAVLKHLIEHPEEAVRIQSMSPVGAARELTRIEGKLTPTAVTKKQPPAIPDISARGGRVAADPASVDAAAARLFGAPS